MTQTISWLGMQHHQQQKQNNLEKQEAGIGLGVELTGSNADACLHTKSAR
jgi:hypothetical protein